MKRAQAYSKNRQRNRSSQVYHKDKVVLTGGLNLVHSASKIKPGELLVVKNYEPFFIDGAYRRTGGFERFDGQPRPHLAEYWKVELTGITNGPFTVGNTATADSGETGTISRYVVTDTNGNGYIILTDLSDNVVTGAVWTEGSVSATATTAAEFEGEEDEDEHDRSRLSAETIRRGAIGAVGGASCDGSTLGVNVYNSEVYAFRDNVGHTATTMWKETSGGWTEVDLGIKIRFIAGSTPIEEGDTVSGATSGAQCTAERIVVTDGFWTGGDA
ncbi:MAG TPA: hypothetical protein VFI27_05650, partial [candidate division Zixibacteria bacterium]|nr:hypothetical protein [candidate division Zixibacteria bacterium]